MTDNDRLLVSLLSEPDAIHANWARMTALDVMAVLHEVRDPRTFPALVAPAARH
ncbi:MAG TPA: hypothetical protein VGP92_19010 [Acidimicrobiia bacterium]|jgi:hypothetical protein|nr:hypothetical protein [Acidimicrobiia bacterium]